jgi:hypothetical protein
MQYMKLDATERQALLAGLSAMPAYLGETYSRLSAEQAAEPGPDGAFAPVEQVWHLADLEREGFGMRIERLLSGCGPQLPDFDGAAVATARNYRTRSLAAGLDAFASARARNIAMLQGIESSETWAQSGTQEGVGRVSLCDMPGFMSQHDAAHRAEIEEWKSRVAQ